MRSNTRDPEPLAGGNRASGLLNAGAFDSPDNNATCGEAQIRLALILDGFDPARYPILSRHWFGVDPIAGAA
jgi:hypothetical protein